MNTTNGIQAQPSKSRIHNYWAMRVIFASGLLLVFYYGYCWGFWGKRSLLLQYLFQCTCPAGSEEKRYPDGIDVLISACTYAHSIVSPSGRMLYVQQKQSKNEPGYLFDLQTGNKTPFSLGEGTNLFLSDELLFHSFYGDDQYIYDRTTNTRYPIRSLLSLEPKAYHYGELNLDVLFRKLLHVEVYS